MIGLVQRVKEAEVVVEGEQISRIGNGILLLAGIAVDDGGEDVRYIARKVAHLRIFGDETGNLNRSLIDTNGEILVVSQFTLLGDTRRGRRPSFTDAAGPSEAEVLYQTLIEELKTFGISVAEGRFGAMMDVHIINSGPVTLILNSKDKIRT
jgi:D-tyrosyl-tRNA(Tyr) deacylase